MVVIAAVHVVIGRGRCRPPNSWHDSFTVNTPLLPGLPSCFHLLCIVLPNSRHQLSGTAEAGTDTNDCIRFRTSFNHQVQKTTLEPVAAITMIGSSQCTLNCTNLIPSCYTLSNIKDAASRSELHSFASNTMTTTYT